MKYPIDAVKFSNTMQLSPNSQNGVIAVHLPTLFRTGELANVRRKM